MFLRMTYYYYITLFATRKEVFVVLRIVLGVSPQVFPELFVKICHCREGSLFLEGEHTKRRILPIRGLHTEFYRFCKGGGNIQTSYRILDLEWIFSLF